jgi:hypothetical protein
VAGDLSKALELLTALPEVAQAQIAGDQICVTCRDDQDGAAAIARCLVRANFDLLSLVPEQIRLDEAFMQLTRGIVQ